MRIVRSEEREKPVYLIKCDGGFYTEHASYIKNDINSYKPRIVGNPEEHFMEQVGYDYTHSKYGIEKLKEIENMGFKNPHYVEFKVIEHNCIEYKEIIKEN